MPYCGNRDTVRNTVQSFVSIPQFRTAGGRLLGVFLYRRRGPRVDLGSCLDRGRYGNREQFAGCPARSRPLPMAEVPLRGQSLQQSRLTDTDLPHRHLATDQPGHTRNRAGLPVDLGAGGVPEADREVIKESMRLSHFSSRR